MSRKDQTQRSGKKIPVQEGERLFVGVDVHKKSFHVAVWSQDRECIVTVWCQPSQGKLLADRLDSFRDQVVRLSYETGPTGFGLARELQERGYAVAVVSPAHTRRPAVQRAKTDSLDCRQLARDGADNQLHAVYIPTVEEEQDRQSVRLREQRRDRCKEIKMQIKSFLLYHGIAEPPGLGQWSGRAVKRLRSLALSERLRQCLDLLLDDLARGQAALKEATEAVKALSASPRFQETTGLGVTVPGIAEVTAMGVQTERLAPERFERAATVSGYQGFAPEGKGSGGTVRYGGLMKTGNPRLRTLLLEAAWNWVRCDPAARKRFRRLAARRRTKQKAIVAMARRLGIILWRMLTRKEPYRGAAAA